MTLLSTLLFAEFHFFFSFCSNFAKVFDVARRNDGHVWNVDVDVWVCESGQIFMFLCVCVNV